ncbi:MAG: carbon-nitrogen hydrolase family protein [Deltaproteobacteria bacterium]|nr:carbon-nitrogen hydrolase family protein [Deltaproteobacteria bacterium]
MSRLLGIGACQMETCHADVEANLDALAKKVEAIKSCCSWVQLICAPELIISGVGPMADTAEAIPGPITAFCSKLAREQGIYLVPGSIYEKAEDRIFNTAPVFDPSGSLVAVYRKMYPWRPHEKTAAGNRTITFEVAGVGIVGLCICYDLWFPEVIRDLVWKGAEIVLIPTLTVTQDRRQELILCQAAAAANQCYVVSVNGTRPGGVGRSVIIDPEGRIMQEAGQLPENLMSMLDLDQVDQARRYGTCGVSRVMSSFFHEAHRFEYQTQAYDACPAAISVAGFQGDDLRSGT